MCRIRGSEYDSSDEINEIVDRKKIIDESRGDIGGIKKWWKSITSPSFYKPYSSIGE